MERLASRIEHLRAQNEVLNLTLAESKNTCDDLTVLIGGWAKRPLSTKPPSQLLLRPTLL